MPPCVRLEMPRRRASCAPASMPPGARLGRSIGETWMNFGMPPCVRLGMNILARSTNGLQGNVLYHAENSALWACAWVNTTGFVDHFASLVSFNELIIYSHM